MKIFADMGNAPLKVRKPKNKIAHVNANSRFFSASSESEKRAGQHGTLLSYETGVMVKAETADYQVRIPNR
jgi:hypothetical protein